MIPIESMLQLALLAPLLGSAYAQSNSTVQLQPFVFTPLPLGSIQPMGWLQNQMQLMAAGLAGNEYDFFPYVQDNPWIGGTQDYSDLNEAIPYWFNGVVSLAYGLNDPTLINQVTTVANYVLSHQNSTTGWLGPETTYDSNSLWARMPMAYGLMQLAEANPNMTQQIVDAFYKFIPLMDDMLLDGQSETEAWGRTRYADMNIVMQWLYEKHPNDNTSVLIECMDRWRQHGVDWAGYYTQANYLFQDIDLVPIDESNNLFPNLHGVNVGQGLKTMGVNYRFTNDKSLIQVSHDAANWTFTYHGAASGSILADEREAGLNPDRGSELCTTVETMRSMTYLYQLFGDPLYGDHAELAAFNALPTQMSPNHWVHQYLALPNQPFAVQVPDYAGLWWNDQIDGIVYGIDPNYPCCAVNHPQGWPKYAASIYSLAGDNGLAATQLGPATTKTMLNDGTQVTISSDMAYPFTPILSYNIQASGPFTFYLRIPQWQGSTPNVTINGTAATVAGPDDHQMLAISLPAGTSAISATLSPEIVVEPRANNTVSVHYGPLLYAVDLGQDITTNAPEVPNAPADSATQYINNTAPWNLALDPTTLQYFGPTAANSTVTLANMAFDYQAPPNYITAQACEIDWPLFHGVPGPVPLDGSRTCTGSTAEVTLRPYGSLRARMSEFPIMNS